MISGLFISGVLSIGLLKWRAFQAGVNPAMSRLPYEKKSQLTQD